MIYFQAETFEKALNEANNKKIQTDLIKFFHSECQTQNQFEAVKFEAQTQVSDDKVFFFKFKIKIFNTFIKHDVATNSINCLKIDELEVDDDSLLCSGFSENQNKLTCQVLVLIFFVIDKLNYSNSSMENLNSKDCLLKNNTKFESNDSISDATSLPIDPTGYFNFLMFFN